MNSTPRDTIYASQHDKVDGFSFDKRVVSVFPDMISRSVPGYVTAIAMLPSLADLYLQRDTQVYDLGCSLGASTLAVAQVASSRNCNIVGIDNSAAMLEKCQQLVDQSGFASAIELRCGDLVNASYENASMAIMNYTLQFVAVEQRLELLKGLQKALLPGGVLILSEKITFPDPQINQDMINLHQAFKRENGYSELEISQKRAALENILIPEQYSAHQERLQQAGFSRVEVICQTLNFCTMLAIK
ncbi:MAG: carboxy-S-adenosyl-L-methionine synthase CmoA [Pseudomonadales bacterium]|nr:carboxy-S-adenosyl-L-methionine synthase CmoA [Pseudomonadales bacterium]